MDSLRGGYTVVEVFIVLAVSGAMLFSAVAVFSGKHGQAQFNQAMQDLDSKIKTYANDVGVSVFPQAENFECRLNVTTDRPYLLSGSQVTGTNEDCLFLGKALRVTPGADTITAYTVLGNRTYDSVPCVPPGGTIGRTPVTNFSQACPEPAVNITGADIPQLVEQYKFPYQFGTLVKSWVEDNYNIPANQSYDLVGFYNSLQTSAVPDTDGSQSLLFKAYRIVGGRTHKDCIEEHPACLTATPKKWTMCFRSDNGRETATLAVINSPAGVTTELQIKPDPAVCS